MPERHQQKRATIAANLAATSGRTIEDWVAVVEGAPVEGFMNIVKWLKTEHGLTHFQARLIAEEHRDATP